MQLVQTTHFKRDYKKLLTSIQKRTDEKLKFLSNNRVLIWNSIPTQINQSPELVIGQKDLYSNQPGLAAGKLNWPVGVATDGKHLLVADTESNRVLIKISYRSSVN